MVTGTSGLRLRIALALGQIAVRLHDLQRVGRRRRDDRDAIIR
jgi:hypothetical protein